MASIVYNAAFLAFVRSCVGLSPCVLIEAHRVARVAVYKHFFHN